MQLDIGLVSVIVLMSKISYSTHLDIGLVSVTVLMSKLSCSTAAGHKLSFSNSTDV